MKNQPNIVLIIADQWRGDCVGMLGNPYIDTPNLDNLFSEGTAFTQAYSAVPSCIAARASLLTGMCPKNHGRVGYKDRVPWDYKHTMPGELAKAGYHTHCVGKMHVFPARNLMGFHSVELHDGYLHNERCRNTPNEMVDDYLPWLKDKCGADVDITDAGVGCNGYSVTPWPYEERYHPTNWVTSRSIDFLNKRDPSKPFFLKVSYHRPHPPLDPPKHYLERYLDRELPPLKVGDWAGSAQELSGRGLDSPVPTDEKQIDLARRAYYAQLTHIDCQLNRLIHAVNEHELMDDTMFLFVSDHGDMLYDHNSVAKALPYSGSAKIPLMVKLPPSWEIDAVSELDVPVELRDIMPTFLDAADSEIPDSVDGLSLLPLCRGEKETLEREYIHGEHSAGEASNHWITNGKEMYVWYSQTGEEHYFDIINDPDNMKNIIDKKTDRVEYLRNCLIDELRGREEGYVKDDKLIIGQEPKAVLSFLEQE